MAAAMPTPTIKNRVLRAVAMCLLLQPPMSAFEPAMPADLPDPLSAARRKRDLLYERRRPRGGARSDLASRPLASAMRTGRGIVSRRATGAGGTGAKAAGWQGWSRPCSSRSGSGNFTGAADANESFAGPEWGGRGCSRLWKPTIRRPATSARSHAGRTIPLHAGRAPGTGKDARFGFGCRMTGPVCRALRKTLHKR
jgi:hypothetical protein